jgi:hypothetical protein
MFLYRALPTIDGTLSVMILVARCVVFSHYRLGEAVGGFDDDPSALAVVLVIRDLERGRRSGMRDDAVKRV